MSQAALADHVTFPASQSKPSALVGYIPEADFAAELAVSLRTVRRWDSLRVGPARTIIGRKIYYSRASIEKWLSDRTVRPCRTSRRARVSR